MCFDSKTVSGIAFSPVCDCLCIGMCILVAEVGFRECSFLLLLCVFFIDHGVDQYSHRVNVQGGEGFQKFDDQLTPLNINESLNRSFQVTERS